MQINPWFRKGHEHEEEVVRELDLLRTCIPPNEPQASFSESEYNLNSLAVANGASESFGQNDSHNICYRSLREWDHVEGAANLTFRPRSISSPRNFQISQASVVATLPCSLKTKTKAREAEEEEEIHRVSEYGVFDLGEIEEGETPQ
jgi:hypothetical protein